MNSESRKTLLLTNSATRIRSRDAFMLMALWMEHHPHKPKLSKAQPTGCVLVSPQDRVVALEHNGEAHAVVRAIISSTIDPHGCDIYVSRFPCSLCTKVMVQAGIRKCYYFPAEHWEMHSSGEELSYSQPRSPIKMSSIATSPSFNNGGTSDFPTLYSYSPGTLYTSGLNGLSIHLTRQDELKERNRQSVQRLVANNPIAFSLYIPQWYHSDENLDTFDSDDEIDNFDWKLDPSIEHSVGISARWNQIRIKFGRTKSALHELYRQYHVGIVRQHVDKEGQVTEEENEMNLPPLAHHAIVLAHIAAKRTDDPKVGVGAIIVNNGKYISVGWNGFPKKSQHLDYPQAGADDSVDDSELKYNYSLHAEQNALLWRYPQGCRLEDGQDFESSFLVTTKMPCDECSPMVSDIGIQTVYTNRQNFRSPDDPLKHRGLSYDKCHALLKNVLVFNTSK